MFCRFVLAVLLTVAAVLPAGAAVAPDARKPTVRAKKASSSRRAPVRTASRPTVRRASAKSRRVPPRKTTATPSKASPAPRGRTAPAPVPLTVATRVVQTGCLTPGELESLAVSFGLPEAEMGDVLAGGQPGQTAAPADAAHCVSVATASNPSGSVDTVAFVAGRPDASAVPALLRRDAPLVAVQAAAWTCEVATHDSLTLPVPALDSDVEQALAEVPENLRWEVGIIARRMAGGRPTAADELLRILFTAGTAEAPSRLLGVELLDSATGRGITGVWWLPREDRPGALVGAGDVEYERLLWQSAVDYKRISRGVGAATRSVRRRVTVKNASGERVTRVRTVRIASQHVGVDMSAPTGTPVHAVADATVAFRGRRGAFGNLVILDHGHGYQTFYAHLSKFAADLAVGQTVRRGDVIALVGSTGRSTGPHLHFEVRENGQYVDPFDDEHQVPVWDLHPDEESVVLLRALALRAAREGAALPVGSGCSGGDTLALE